MYARCKTLKNKFKRPKNLVIITTRYQYSELPLKEDEISGVHPLVFLASKFAPFSTRYLVTAILPLKEDKISGVFPSLSISSMFAPCSMRYFVTSKFPGFQFNSYALVYFFPNYQYSQLPV